MMKFITHEAVAGGTFSRTYSPPNAGVWQEPLCNAQPDVLDLFLQRLEKDFEALHVKQRKPWTGKDLVPRFGITFVPAQDQLTTCVVYVLLCRSHLWL